MLARAGSTREAVLKARHEEITALLRANLPDSALAVMPSLPVEGPRKPLHLKGPLAERPFYLSTHRETDDRYPR
jgi:hypothetical protein